MTQLTHAKLPRHLRKYVVEQNYARYTSEDQAVWRFILRQLKDYLARHAHPSYLEGLNKTGISIERIPEIEDIDRKLNAFGWGAVPVSGFIPPAAFMEFQSIGVLPIASDMRTLDHLLYTPAPDIVHEAAGHAPILADPEYATYLRQYGEVARHSIISKQDLDQYEAIRVLSDIKEDPRSTKEEIAQAERRLQEVNASLKSVSEAGLLSRMNWWTAEYGLIGDTKNPRIFGAGLLSSVGESWNCLSDSVRKMPLSVDCVEFGYDITEQQPQLFVARDFKHLGEVLDDLAVRLSYRRGGRYGLDQAIAARTVNTVQLESGLQISGLPQSYLLAGEEPCYLRFAGPCQLSLNYAQIPGQGVQRHAHGFSSPIGPLPTIELVKGKRCRLEYKSGVVVEGVIESWLEHEGRLVLVTFTDCRVSRGSEVLFDPAWGPYDMAVGTSVTSVFGGPADRGAFGETDSFANKRVPVRNYSTAERERFAFLQEIRDLREGGTLTINKWQRLTQKYISTRELPWLGGIELMELAHQLKLSEAEVAPLQKRLADESERGADLRLCINKGLHLARAKS